MSEIIVSGGGGFSAEASIALDEYILGVVRRTRSVVRPRIVFLPTACGDAEHYILKFYRRFSGQADCSHLSLFRRERNQPHFSKTLLEADLIYAGGGTEPSRRRAQLDAVASGRLPSGWGLSDRTALHFSGAEPVARLSTEQGAEAFWIEAAAGRALERPLELRFLPDPDPELESWEQTALEEYRQIALP